MSSISTLGMLNKVLRGTGDLAELPTTATVSTFSTAGSAYTAADVLTVVGGKGTAATITVNTVDGTGAITGATLLAAGSYTDLPINPVSVTGGTGTGAEFTMTYTDVISGATGNIGKRIIDFMNNAIDMIAGASINWPSLRLDSQGTADGINDIYEFSGTQTANVGGAVSIWVVGVGQMMEVTPAQFDKFVADSALTGNPQIFQRGVASSGRVQIQLYPLPTAGQIINMSGFIRPTVLSEDAPAAISEFDTSLIVNGTLMQMDSYDGVGRGYATLFSNSLANEVLNIVGNQALRIEVEDYT